MARPKKLVKKKEKLSKEESLYRSAVSLMEAVDCVNRFERVVFSLRDAAKKFEKLGEYKDSKERKEKCLKDADAARIKGTAEVYDTAVIKLEQAKTKSDFVDAIEDFKRVRKFDYKKEECNQKIQMCQKGIGRLETIAIYKRRGIALCIVALIVAGFINTPFYPLVKGMVYQSKGDTEKALKYYIESGGILNGNGKKKECYYDIAESLKKKGSYEEALKNYKLAMNKFDAETKAFELEKGFINASSPGEVVYYGEEEWIVLDKEGDHALLFEKDAVNKEIFDKEGKNIWYSSSLRKWLNTRFIETFSEDEKAVMISQDDSDKKDNKNTSYIFVLSNSQYDKYKEHIIPVETGYWLRDGATKADRVWFVKDDASVGETSVDNSGIAVRGAFWVKYK